MRYLYTVSDQKVKDYAEDCGFASDLIDDELLDAVESALANSTIPETVEEVIYTVLDKHLGPPRG